jgi:hypothetical protein
MPKTQKPKSACKESRKAGVDHDQWTQFTLQTRADKQGSSYDREEDACDHAENPDREK